MAETKRQEAEEVEEVVDMVVDSAVEPGQEDAGALAQGHDDDDEPSIVAASIDAASIWRSPAAIAADLGTALL